MYEEYRRIAEAYVQALRLSDNHAMRSLFDEAAVVRSPVYGDVVASKFYDNLFSVTRESILIINDIFLAVDKPLRMAIHFEYVWTLRSGDRFELKVVDVIDINKHGKIKNLEIIYDASQTRISVKKLQSTTSRAG